MPLADRLSLFRRSAPVGYRSKYDSCLDRIEETISYADATLDEKLQNKNSKRRSTTFSSTYSPKSFIYGSKPNLSSSKKLLSFIHKGFHGSKSKSMSRMDQQDFLRIATDRKNIDAMNSIIPIPIRETAIQSHSKTLFHKLPKSNVRAKPLLKLNCQTKFIPMHPSLLSKKFGYCVKIISLFPTDYRKCSSGHKYELLLPTGTRSLGHTCHITSSDKLRELCSSCHSSHLSLFGKDEQLNHLIGYVFACSSENERKKWLNVLTTVAKPTHQNERRRETSLNIWIQEAKNVATKKRYFCEIYLDETLHARTTTKTMANMLFWGEEFHLCNLDEIKTVTILLWKASHDSKKKKKSHQQLICQVSISTKDIEQRSSIEKWYSASHYFNSSTIGASSSHAGQNSVSSMKTSENHLQESIQIPNLSHSSVSSSTNDQTPMIRIKARYQNFDVLPIKCYSSMLEFLRKNAVALLLEMESYLKVKNKEDLAGNLIIIIHQQGIAVEFLCDLIIHEIRVSDDQNMILRGNTMASKAIEVYLKLIGEKYLSLTLSDFVNRVLQGDDDCEVDPEKDKQDYHQQSSNTYNGCHSSGSHEKLNAHYSLQQRQESLLMNVDMAWAKIMSSSIYFPKNLKSVFIALRRRLEKLDQRCLDQNSSNEPNLCDRIISACIFLRYICPAILTPSLFGLIPEYPDNPKVTRTFTLVAKCIQTLANFSDLTGYKESYMVFMNSFIENKFPTMRSFLQEISTKSDEKEVTEKSNSNSSDLQDNQNCLYWENLSNSLSEETIDLSLCLAKLHRQLEDYLKLIPAQNLTNTMEILYGIIEEINGKLRWKQPACTQTTMKYSQSYQDIKVNHKLQHTNDAEYLNSSSFSTILSRVTDKASRNSENLNRQMRSRKLSNENTRQNTMKSLNSLYGEEISPPHSILDTSTSDSSYLMTQSMIEDNYSFVPQSNMMSRDQVDKEWREMVTQSDSYANPMNTTLSVIGEKPIHDKQLINPSQYQSVNRMLSISGKPGPNISIDKPPSPPSLTNTLRKCKQGNRRGDYVDNVCQLKKQTKFNDMAFRRNSIDEMKYEDAKNSLSRQYEIIDSCSTETITSKSVQKPKKYGQTRSLCSMNSSCSMPSFDISELANDYRCSALHNGLTNRSSHRNESHESHNQFPFPYNNISNNNQINDDLNPSISLDESKVKHMKRSLDKLHQTLNARMTQLVLADSTTIQLELERVRLMKHIFGCSSKQEFEASHGLHLMGINSKFVPPNGNAHDSIIVIHNSGSSTKISVEKYLQLAENVLTESQINQTKAEPERQPEHLLMQIFETNQSLQNRLINKLDCYISNSELQMKNVKAFGTASSNTNCQINEMPNYRTPFITDTTILKKNSSNASLLNSSSSAIIELIDAV